MKKFAIVGCGQVAARHAENILRIGQLKATCDILEERADELAGKYNATAYYSVDDLVRIEKDVDVVVVCTPNGLHAEHVIKSLQAGKDVLCEKPLCLTTAAAWQIIETEKFCRKKLFVVKSTRYNHVVQNLKKAVSNGSLGEVYSFQLNCIWNRPDAYFTDWRGKLFPDGGTLYTQFSHYIDAMLWVFGEVDEVRGFRKNLAHKSIEFEDTGTAALLMKAGSLGSLHWSVNAFQKNFEISLTLIAEKGTIRIGGEYLDKLQYQLTEGDDLFLDERKSDTQSSQYKTAHHKLYDHLQQVLETGDDSFAGVYDGLKTVETIEKIYKAVS